MVEDDLHWIVASNPPGCERPEWCRSVAVAPDGTIFAPAVIAGAEARVLFCAIHDSVPLVSDAGHWYMPTWWLRREYPAESEVCAAIERVVHRVVRENDHGASG